MFRLVNMGLTYAKWLFKFLRSVIVATHSVTFITLSLVFFIFYVVRGIATL